MGKLIFSRLNGLPAAARRPKHRRSAARPHVARHLRPRRERHRPMSATLSASPAAELNTPAMQRRINTLRVLDNVTNWLYLAREYAFLALVLATAISFYEFRSDWGLAWAWNIPVTVLAITLVGACQHRISTLAHEASH